LRSIDRSGGSRNAISPVSLNPSVRPTHRSGLGRHSITADELRAQAWLDDRLVAFYREGHGLWPRVRRIFRTR
jgi:hypothetical protein